MTAKKILAIVLTFIMAFGVFSVAYADGEVPDGYTPIYTAEDLNNIRNNLSDKFILMNHIDLSDYGAWESLGEYEKPFCGELNGNGYSVIGLNGEKSLLGRTENATIKNLGIFNCSIIRPEKTAGSSTVAGSFAEIAVNSTFDGCFATGEIQGCIFSGLFDSIPMCSIGGLVGKAQNCRFVNCYSNVSIHFIYDKLFEGLVGGLAGDCYDSHFKNCYSTSIFSSEQSDVFGEESGRVYSGGISGSGNGTCVFENCFYLNNVEFAVGKDKTIQAGTKKLTELQMKDIQSYEGFDFENIWEMPDNSYPVLRNAKSVLNKNISINYKEKASIVLCGNAETVEWNSEDETVAIVNGNGEIQGTGIGNTTVTVKTSDNQTEEINVTVSYSFWQKIIVYLFFGWIWY